MQNFEILGSFYLGKEYDTKAGKRTENLLLYDSKDLVTHAVCVGMTGSGKTGLCIGLLEEAAIDNIPALIIDPKGDLGNLLLTFPQLRPEDFRPWVNESDAATKGMSVDDFAAGQAKLWAKGLSEWGQDGARIQRLRDAAEVRIYTPGSNAGLPLAVIKSFDAPPPAIIDDRELFAACVQTTASSLLGLVGVTADPIKSREHILISNILSSCWSNGESLDLAGLIGLIQRPPFAKIGVLDVESFYPGKDRFELAMQVNNLLAAPGFSAWMEGQPMDVQSLLYTPQGKPRLAIVSIAHLSDSERMFVVSLLLNQMLAWTRSQSGTTSLRAILYMDEIAGYFPPTANPPSKQPLLTMMKQARAFGVGVVLATQNPVDLDYKGLSNAGTWFVGRLQTEQDKARLLDGLEGAMSTASKAFDRKEMERTLSGLGKRVFLMNNVHEDGPAVFETRWALSYLRGPIDRSQIRALMEPVKKLAVRTQPAPQPAPAAAPVVNAAASARPVLPPEVPQYFIPLRGTSGPRVVYTPVLMGFAAVRFSDAKAGVDTDAPCNATVAFGDGPVAVNWEQMAPCDLDHDDVEREPARVNAEVAYTDLPPAASKAKAYKDWEKDFADAIFRTRTLELLRSTRFKEVSRPGESEAEFRVRLQQRAREERDATAEKLRQKYAPKFATLEERLRKAQQALEVQQAQSRSAKVGSLMSIGAAVLGGFLGRKSIAGTVGKVGTAARGVSRTVQESGDVKRAEENIAATQQQLEDMKKQFEDEAAAAQTAADAAGEAFEKITLRPKKTNIHVRAVVLAWEPRAG